MGISVAARAFVQWITRPTLGPTWGEVADAYEREALPALAVASRSVYRSWLRTARTVTIAGRPLVEHRLGELRLLQVQAVYRQLIGRPQQAEQVARMVGRVVQWAYDGGLWIGPNPARSFRAPARQRRENPLDTVQLRALLLALEVPETGPIEERLLLRLLAQTGWRIGEARSLRIGCVKRTSWEGYRFGLVHLRTTKTGAQDRTVSARALATILRASRGRSVGYVFCRPGSDTPLRPDSVRAVLTAACEAAGIERRVPHDLRHTFTTLLSRQGVPIADVGALVGHKSAQTTLRYCHSAIDELVGALRIAEEVER